MKYFLSVLLLLVYSFGFCTKIILGHGDSIEGEIISANTQEIYLLFKDNKLAIINKKSILEIKHNGEVIKFEDLLSNSYDNVDLSKYENSRKINRDYWSDNSIMEFIGDSPQKKKHTEPEEGCFIKLDSGKLIIENFSIKRPILGKPYILTKNEKRIEFKDVRYYQNMDGFFHSIPDMFSRDLFAERIEHGKIDLFSIVSISTTPDINQTHSLPGGDFTTTNPGMSLITRVDYYKKNKGPLLSANYKNLKEDLADNQQSMKYLSEYKTLSYLQGGCTLACVGFFIGGVSNASQNEGIPSEAKTMFTLAGVFSGATYLIYLLKPNKVQKAIKVYNK